MGARLAATGPVDFTQKQSAAIAIIGAGADGPTAIRHPRLARSCWAPSPAVYELRLCARYPAAHHESADFKKERNVDEAASTVTKTSRSVIFPIMVTIIVSSCRSRRSGRVCWMPGNLMKECGVVDRIQKTAGNELMNIITIFLALSVGCTTSANTFLNSRTLFIIVLGPTFLVWYRCRCVLCGKMMYASPAARRQPADRSRSVSPRPPVAGESGPEQNPPTSC